MWRVVPATFGDRRVFDQLQGLVEGWRATWGDFRWHGRGGSEIFRSYSQCLTPGEAKSLYQLKHLRVDWIHQLKRRIASEITEDQPLRGALPTGCWNGLELRKQPASAGFFFVLVFKFPYQIQHFPE
jgi:hypothetical protein